MPTPALGTMITPAREISEKESAGEMEEKLLKCCARLKNRAANLCLEKLLTLN